MPQNYELSHDRSLNYLQITVDCATREFARVRMPLESTHRNGFGVAHGGLICALADTAFGAAANAGSEYPVVTMSMSVNFLRPGVNGPLVAEARLLHNGDHILNYDIKVMDAENQIIASAMASGYITGIPLRGLQSTFNPSQKNELKKNS